MPRRRKSVHSNKAPLIFTESPVNKQSNVPSPVCCARHPLTAKSVPVEDLQDVSWVSPQFQGGIGSSRKTKKQRKRRSTSGPKCTCHCGSNQNGLKVNAQNNKFEPLKFIGEKTPPVTIIEDLSFSEDEDDLENISQQSVSPVLNRSQSALKRHVRPSRKKSPKNSWQKVLIDNQQISEDSENCAQDSESFDLGNMSVHTPITNVKSRNIHLPIDQNETISQLTSLTNDSEDQSDTPVNKVKSPVKRLFTSINSSPVTNVFTLIKHRKMSKVNEKHSDRVLKNLYSSVCSSPNPSNQNVEVLVADTPETEYGMTLRLRRLRRLKSNDNT